MNDPSALEDAKRALAEAGVTLAGYGVVPLGGDADANRRIFEFAKSLGLEYVSADPDPEAFDAVDKLVEEFGVAVGIHNHGPGHRYAKIETISDAIKDHHHKIGCCIDTGHFLRSREDPVDAAEAFAGRTYGVHLKDVKDANDLHGSGQGRSSHGRLPQGPRQRTNTNIAWRSSTRRAKTIRSPTSRPAWPRPPRRSRRFEKPEGSRARR